MVGRYGIPHGRHSLQSNRAATTSTLLARCYREKQNRVIFGGRLGEYKYYNMDDVIESALNMLETKIK